ncbi:DUF3488 and transglutaminase-like domain-containing protein [Rhodococcus sp. X156]|uniref:transglutaminase TgpA family protein n=1 Tax=Rhodococcus sp. X156 TaxID=2499145 RepID=UPI000FDAB373|nr:DUF3488 and transglutaminase-like domain-containing protein [Rhodococcus sp. X156]
MTFRDARPAQALVGALALLLASAALATLFTSSRWVLPVAGTFATVAAVGVVLRLVRVPHFLVPVGQLLALGVLLCASFAGTALPGPAALTRLRELLSGAGAQIANEQSPVAVTDEMLLLLVLCLGCAAVLVDLLVAGIQTPAVAGLVLLCVVAVPASLSSTLLAWWSFALGALGVLLLLLSDGSRRAALAGPSAGMTGLRSPLVAVSVAGALACALWVGTAATGVGTSARLQGTSGGSDGVALNPFTELRGDLTRESIPLFTVEGMTAPTYLRAVTLDTFVNDRGWVVEELPAGTPAGDRLAQQGLVGSPQDVTIRGLGYNDRWLPSPGIPVALRGLDEQLRGYRYNAEAGVLQASQRQQLPSYVVQAVDPGTSVERLRAVGAGQQSQAGVDARWRQLDGVDPRVSALARQVAGSAPTTFDAAVLLSDFFTNRANGFTYDLRAGDGTVGEDALVDFLTRSRRGFCEQYASAMGVMLRELGIASRVVLGYTPGTGDASQRTVTTDDAHAWVEVYFTGVGWVRFDPTPLAQGRNNVPSYVREATAGDAAPESAAPAAAPAPAPQPAPAAPTETPPPPTPAPEDEPQPAAAPPATSSNLAAAVGWTVLAVTLLGAICCVPVVLRRSRRSRRMAVGSADAAWAELVDVAADHGLQLSSSDTARTSGQRLSDELGLDEPGRAAVAGLVEAVELAWYGDPSATAGTERSCREALQRLTAAEHRCAPLPWLRRALPLSVLCPRWAGRAPRELEHTG